MPNFDPYHIETPSRNRRSVDVLQPCIKKKEYTRRLLLDTRDASVTNGPFDVSFRLTTDVSRDRYRNIKSISLVAACIPKVDGENYVILDIDELRDRSNLDASNQTAHDGFNVVFFDSSFLSPGQYKPMDKLLGSPTALFDPPVPGLDKLSIKIKKHDGNVVSVSETANVVDCSFLFDVTCLC